jgi:hypothetical protein
MPPPQSTSVSLPSLIPSVHVAGRQMSVVGSQSLVVQSELTRQPCRGGQAVQVPPPQSTPVSVPSSTPSLHVGTTQAWSMHAFAAQSRFRLHALPTEHPGHSPPPQSTAVS